MGKKIGPTPEDRPRAFGEESMKISPELQKCVEDTQTAASHVTLETGKATFMADTKLVGKPCWKIANENMLKFKPY